MNLLTRIATTLLLTMFIFPIEMSGKKIKQSLKVEKQTKQKVTTPTGSEGFEVNMNDDAAPELKEIREQLSGCAFTGYEKEGNSNHESFILVNPSEEVICGYRVRIDYLDMQNRMLHSRELKESCYVPAGETRKFDVKSWDPQHSYYYYLGNEPRRVAIPFQVVFTPISYWIERE